ncbi:hypothetical protein C8Q74DRAFT_32254 [Fomes fomentarius]|nr:hypothetical protein C8Q74DRAFT_32254 [Fomes fomentarius]
MCIASLRVRVSLSAHCSFAAAVQPMGARQPTHPGQREVDERRTRTRKNRGIERVSKGPTAGGHGTCLLSVPPRHDAATWPVRRYENTELPPREGSIDDLPQH